jgi:hypothetical protein
VVEGGQLQVRKALTTIAMNSAVGYKVVATVAMIISILHNQTEEGDP